MIFLYRERERDLRLFLFPFLLSLALMTGGSAFAEDDAGTAHATMTCERAATPGRVRCEVEARVGPGESIAWGDVVLIRMPPFATALRGRIGPHDASVREAALWRWAFAVVARENGSGEIEGRVRVVVCRDQTCATRVIPVIGRVAAGG
jgi:hypothetical protein